MEPAILSATSALLGSLIGGVSTFAASWFTHRGQLRTQAIAQQAIKLESLYAEFIIEATKRIADAWSHHAETPEVVAGLYSAVERMRLVSSDEVIDAAEQVVNYTLGVYTGPDRTFDELQRQIRSDEFRDPLRNFSDACRRELGALRG
jgi:hypothetical protein